MNTVLMPKARTPEFWQNIRENRDYIEKIRKTYEASWEKDIIIIPFSAWKHFYTTGDRFLYHHYEGNRRVRMTSAALMSLIYPEEPKYLQDLEDVLWATCEEFSWVNPAHVHFAEDGERTYIDLLCAHVASSLAEISCLLEDRLDPRVLRFIRETVGHRILENLDKYAMNWEWTVNNWAAVISCEVGVTMMYLFPERFEEYLPRLWKTLEYFISGYADDGTCLEGIGYWDYGMAHFVWFADMVKQFTGGKVDLFSRADRNKLSKMAAYCQSVFLKGGSVVSYGDTSRTGGSVNAVLYFYLHKQFPETVRGLDRKYLNFELEIGPTFLRVLRYLYYIDETKEAANLMEKQDGRLPESFDYPNSGQIIVNEKNYSLAVKAGHNDECTGHNDVGNFILATDAGQIFCDLGCGSYSREYFDLKTRYLEFCAGSQGHSVPIINGKYQQQGREHCGTISHIGNVINLEISKAYGLDELTILDRTFSYDEEFIVLTDRFEPNYQSITERFVTLIEPKVLENTVVVDNVSLEFDPSMVTVSAHPVVHLCAGNKTETAYCIDFALAPGFQSVSFRIHIPGASG